MLWRLRNARRKYWSFNCNICCNKESVILEIGGNYQFTFWLYSLKIRTCKTDNINNWLFFVYLVRNINQTYTDYCIYLQAFNNLRVTSYIALPSYQRIINKTAILILKALRTRKTNIKDSSCSLTWGVNANILSWREYNLLVERIPTSRLWRPDRPSFWLRPVMSSAFIYLYAQHLR